MQLRTPHIAIVVVGVAVIASAVIASAGRFNQKTTVSADKPIGTAQLTLNPSTQTANVDQEFSVDIMLNTDGDPASAVDVVLDYDPELLELVDADAATPGAQVAAGSLFKLVAANTATLATGRVLFSAVQQAGESPVTTANGTLATLTFKAKGAGAANINFVYQEGKLSDTNVIKAGTDPRDLLYQVTNATVTIGQ